MVDGVISPALKSGILNTNTHLSYSYFADRTTSSNSLEKFASNILEKKKNKLQGIFHNSDVRCGTLLLHSQKRRPLVGF